MAADASALAVVFLAVVPLAYWVFTKPAIKRAEAAAETEVICKSCGEISEPLITSKRHNWVVFWIAVITIIPAIIYALLAGKKYRVCRACGSKEVVPVNSPVGRNLMAQYHSARDTAPSKDGPRLF